MGHEYVKESETFNVNRNGTVPKPTQQDISDGKVLKADGTWGAGGGGGASALNDLTDVNLSSLQDHQPLRYDATNQEWVNGADSFPPLIYSDEEREIGVWRDGKPLYQKTYDLGSDTSISYNSWTEVNATYPTNCELIVRVDCNTSSGTYASGISVGRKANGKFEMQTGRNGNAQNIRYFTIFYTKSSDTPGSGTWTTQGGYAHHYSTSEKVIGTWIDGKPLYEKSYIYENSSGSAGGSSGAVFDVWNLGSDKVIISDGLQCTFVNLVSNKMYPLPYADSAFTNVYVDNGIVKLKVRNDDWGSNYKLYMTARYIKTTD